MATALALSAAACSIPTPAPDDLDFRELLQPLPAAAGGQGSAVLRDPKHFVWGGSVINGEDGRYHMFYSRWDASPGPAGMRDGWLLGSEIAYAVSDRPEGGFVFQKVLLSGRRAEGRPDAWDARTVHNPHIRRFGEKVYLYYIGSRDPGPQPQGSPAARLSARNRIQQLQRVGVIVADSVADLVAGRFERPDQPLLVPRTRIKTAPVLDPSPAGTVLRPDNLIVVNPSVVRRPSDGKYLLYFKGNMYDPGWKATHGVAIGDSPVGPFEATDEFLFRVEGEDGKVLNAEDPFVWFDRDRERFYALLKDFTGKITGESDEPGLALFTSLDGLQWRVAEHALAVPRYLRFQSGSVLPLRRLERPQILLDDDGRPCVLYAACREPAKGGARDGISFNVHIALHSSIPRREPVERTGIPPRTDAPNILLIMADQHRGDTLGCDGHPAVRTPNLDRLAAEGCRFRRAYSSTPSCTPARAALLTGRSPWGHGMLGYYRVAKSYPVELPRWLGDRGYHTHAIGKNHFRPQRNTHGYHAVELDEEGRVEAEGFLSDYRRWFEEKAPDLDPDATGIGWNDYRSRAYQLAEALHPTHWTGDRAVRFIQGYEGKKPFFLKVSFARPHSPYDPPARLLDMYRDADIPDPVLGEWSKKAHGNIHKPKAYTAARNNLGNEVTRRSRAAYYANVTFVDEQIGRILAALTKAGKLDQTVILFTSDHGDMLGDHHLWRKTQPYEGSARIPMILWWGKDTLEAKRGQVRSEVVELRDVLPTFLDVAGVWVPESVEGRSLFDLVRGQTDGWRQYLDLEHATCHWAGNVWTALTDGHHKYIYHAYDGRQQLFDLDRDPGETVDLASDLASDPARAELLGLWRRRMVEHLAERGRPWVVDGELGIRRRKILVGANYPW